MAKKVIKVNGAIALHCDNRVFSYSLPFTLIRFHLMDWDRELLRARELPRS
jgi:hypothetical protein